MVTASLDCTCLNHVLHNAGLAEEIISIITICSPNFDTQQNIDVTFVSLREGHGALVKYYLEAVIKRWVL